jgi:hypothetical protein
MKIQRDQLKSALQDLIGDLLPGAYVEALAPLSEKTPDQPEGTAKDLGYGE